MVDETGGYGHSVVHELGTCDAKSATYCDEMARELKMGNIKFVSWGIVKSKADSPLVRYHIRSDLDNPSAAINYCPWCGGYLATRIGDNLKDVLEHIGRYKIDVHADSLQIAAQLV